MDRGTQLRQERAPRTQWVLRGIDGTERTLQIATGSPVTIGRDLTSDVPVLDAGVSRHHATLTDEDGDLWLDDLHSQNGTFVNGEPVQRSRVKAGDIITFGRTHLTLLGREEEAVSAGNVHDVLRDLSAESLAKALSLARAMATRHTTGWPFRPLLDLVSAAVGADHAAFLTWDSSARRLDLASVRPPDGFPGLTSPAVLALGEAALVSGRAQTAPACATKHATAGVHGSGGPRAVVPFYAGGSARGVLFVERTAEQSSFTAAEVLLLSAMAWVSEPHFDCAGGGYTRPYPRALSVAEKTEVFARSADRNRIRVTGGRSLADREVPDSGRLVHHLLAVEREITGLCKQLAEAGAQAPSDLLRWRCSLRRLEVAARGLRLLCSDEREAPVAVDVAAILADAFQHGLGGTAGGGVHYVGTGSLETSARALAASLSLIAEALQGHPAAATGIEARRESAGESTVLRLRVLGFTCAAPDATKEGSLWCLSIARELVLDVLRGTWHEDAAEHLLEVAIPDARLSLLDTAQV